MAKDEWNLVFKVATGGTGNVYQLYTGNNTMNINNLAAQSLTNPIPEHFKSDIINHWSESEIVQVRVALYKDGAEVAHFLFDGRGSDSTSWFSKEKLISSSYTDLLPEAGISVPINFFSMLGVQGLKYNISRRFYINSEWGGCPADSGWLIIVDQDANGGCPGWEEYYVNVKPAILYSPISTRTVYSKVLHEILAESLTISVKYDSTNLTCFSVCPNMIQMDATTYCYKPCSATMDTANVDQKIEQLRKELTVDKKTTSAYRRSRTSAYEDRTSAKSIGLVGVAVIVSVLGFFVLMDCLKLPLENRTTPKKTTKTTATENKK